MIQTLLLCTTLFFTSAHSTPSASAQDDATYTLNLTLNGEPIDWYVSESVDRNGERFGPNGQERVKILFDGGSIDFNLADWDTWDYAHVMGVEYRRTDAGTYTMSASVRHNDQGWDDYADMIRFSGESVQNGERELMHPHENEQPFTRSQSGVSATGKVLVSAADNVQGEGGTTVTLNLDSEMLASLDEADLEIELTRN